MQNASDSNSDSGGSLWSASESDSWISDTSDDLSFDDDEPIPALLEHGDDGWDSEDDFDSIHGYDTDVGEDADDEGDDESEGEHRREAPNLRRFIRDEITDMYSRRYEMPRNDLPRGPAYLPHVLMTLKQRCPDHFRLALRVSPNTFDQILEQINDDPVFSNDSSNGQMPIEQQLAIALYQFGHNGNAASLQQVANWAGVGKGTVALVTH